MSGSRTSPVPDPSAAPRAGAVAAALLVAACGGDGVPLSPGDGGTGGDGPDPTPPSAWTSAAAGDGFSCATAADGRVFCWGSRRAGRLGDGGTEGVALRPARLRAAGRTDLRLDTVAVGPDHACGLTADGEAFCWGRNDAGQLGASTPGLCPTGAGRVACSPRAVRAAAPLRFGTLSVGGAHTCGVTTDGFLFCWGSNAAGQLGVGAFGGGGAEPLAVLRGASDVAAGALHTCAVALGTEVVCWGANGDGQLGDRTFFPRTAPTVVTIRGATAVTAGARHGCVLAPAHCWGRGGEGQIGDGQRRTVPFPVPVVTDRSFASLDGGAFHTCGVAADGEALCWGSGDEGALGTGVPEDARTVPAPVAGSRSWRLLSAGRRHTCGVDAGGGLWCWGANGRGQLGDGTRVDRPAPEPVAEPAG